MDWDRAIERNREALSAIVAALFALVASARVSGPGMMLPRRVWLMVLLVLRPAEAAVRRLVVIAARALAPVSVRRRAALSTGDYLEVVALDEGILLKPAAMGTARPAPATPGLGLTAFLNEPRNVARALSEIDAELVADRNAWK